MTTDRELAAWRRETRARLLTARAALTTQEHAEKSARVLFQLPDLLGGSIVGAYWPMQGEIDPRPLLDWLVQERATLALPTVVGRGLPLEFHAWRPGDALERGPFGTQHPAVRELVTPDVLLIPLVGFDEQNYRLGYGGGYYDRTLAAMNPKPQTMGLGFELSQLATIHPQPYDVPLDGIVTESGIRMKPQPAQQRRDGEPLHHD